MGQRFQHNEMAKFLLPMPFISSIIDIHCAGDNPVCPSRKQYMKVPILGDRILSAQEREGVRQAHRNPYFLYTVYLPRKPHKFLQRFFIIRCSNLNHHSSTPEGSMKSGNDACIASRCAATFCKVGTSR